MNMRQALTKTVLIGVTLISTAMAAAQTSPMTKVESLVSGVISILNSDRSWEEQQPLIRQEVGKVFDYRAMAQSVLSTNWRQASSSQQQEFQSLFSRLLENTYIGRLQAYNDEEVRYVNEEVDNNRATVQTLIITDSTDIPVDYKFRLRSDGWFIYDVEVERISLVSSYRETYRSVVRRDGMDSLLAQMQDRVSELE